MSQEIIYTSAPRGLRPGSRGFCTVASTEKMAKPLAERLESLSGYRHLFAPTDSNAERNPVLFSHFILNVGGERYHVLSRVADAGLDYSQRSNKLAHHIAFESRELNEAGPAWSLSQPGLMETEWAGEPRVLSAGRQLPTGEPTPHSCATWESITGDAGWAGVLLESAFKDSPQDVYLVFETGMPLLDLLREAEALLPPEKRWPATFSTYFTKLPPGVECRWRCVVKGTAEAESLSRLPHARVIDLCSPLGTPPENQFASAARNGSSLTIGSANERLEETGTGADGGDVDDGDNLYDDDTTSSPPEWKSKSPPVLSEALGSTPPSSAPAVSTNPQVEPPELPQSRQPRGRNWGVWVAVLLLGVLITSALFFSKNIDFTELLSSRPVNKKIAGTRNGRSQSNNITDVATTPNRKSNEPEETPKLETKNIETQKANPDPSERIKVADPETDESTAAESSSNTTSHSEKKTETANPTKPATAEVAETFVREGITQDFVEISPGSTAAPQIPDGVELRMWPQSNEEDQLKFDVLQEKDNWVVLEKHKIIPEKRYTLQFSNGKFIVSPIPTQELSHKFLMVTCKHDTKHRRAIALREPYKLPLLISRKIGSRPPPIKKKLDVPYSVHNYKLIVELLGSEKQPLPPPIRLYEFEDYRIDWMIDLKIENRELSVTKNIEAYFGNNKSDCAMIYKAINEHLNAANGKKAHLDRRIKEANSRMQREDFRKQRKRVVARINQLDEKKTALESLYTATSGSQKKARCTIYAVVGERDTPLDVPIAITP